MRPHFTPMMTMTLGMVLLPLWSVSVIGVHTLGESATSDRQRFLEERYCLLGISSKDDVHSLRKLLPKGYTYVHEFVIRLSQDTDVHQYSLP